MPTPAAPAAPPRPAGGRDARGRESDDPAAVPAADRARGLLRVVPFLRPHRTALLWSVACAGLVAVFWGANLGLVLPVVNVMAEHGSVRGYVDREVAAARAEQADWGVKLANAQEAVAALEAHPAAGRKESVGTVESVAKAQERIATAGRKLQVLEAVQQYVVPYLPHDKFDLLAGLLGVLLAATILKGLCVIAQDVLVGAVIERTVADLREELFAHTLKLDVQTLGAANTGDLMSRFTNDLQQLANGLNLMGGKVVREPLKAVACVFGASLVSWQLTLMGFVLAPLAAVIFAKIGRSLKRASRRSMESMSRLYNTMEETYEGAAVVTAFNAAGRQRDRFRTENRRYLAKAMKIVRVDALTSPTTETLGMLAAFGALLPGAYLVLRQTDSVWGVRLCNGQLDLAELAVLYSFLAGTIDPLRKLSSIFAKLKRSTAAADRLFEVLDRRPAVAAPADPAPVPVRVREIAFSKVGFRYAGADRGDVLDGVTLAVPAGEVVAVVGENGSGKSTLLKLLPRFFDPTHGAVSVNGTDLRDFDPAAWRARVGVVTQETKLFDESIAENIRLGDPAATDEEVRRAAEAARVTDFSDDLPGGLDAVVGAKGGRLSGGQRQRVALARAVLRDPDVLILDEATSAVDALSERLIHDALREFAKGRTVFLVTHCVRASLLDLITTVAVMDRGALVAAGAHADLLETCPAYRRLYRAQLDGDDFEEANRPAPPTSPGGPKRPSHPGSTDFDADIVDFYDPADHPAADPAAEEVPAGQILRLPRTGTDG